MEFKFLVLKSTGNETICQILNMAIICKYIRALLVTYFNVCNYYSKDTLEKAVKSQNYTPNDLPLFLHNIRNLKVHGKQFFTYLLSLKIHFKFEGLLEAWLTRETQDLCNIDDHNREHNESTTLPINVVVKLILSTNEAVFGP